MTSGICWAIARASKVIMMRRSVISPARLAAGSSLDAGRYYNDQPVDYLFWQGMALKASGDCTEANLLFQSFLQWVETQRDKVPDVDFFAVSLPDLVVLDTPAQEKHQQHCLFITALGHLGLGDIPACQQALNALLQR